MLSPKVYAPPSPSDEKAREGMPQPGGRLTRDASRMNSTYKAVYRNFDRVLDVSTDYTTLNDDDVEIPHDFNFMLTRQFSAFAAFVVRLPVVKTIVKHLVRFSWRVLFQYDHHVFIDMLVFRLEYPEVFKMVADKEAQYEFFERRVKETIAGWVNNNDDENDDRIGLSDLVDASKLNRRADNAAAAASDAWKRDMFLFIPRLHKGDLALVANNDNNKDNSTSLSDSYPTSLFGPVNAAPDAVFPYVDGAVADKFTYHSVYQDGDVPERVPKKFDAVAGNRTVLFAKPRWGAYGEGCEFMDKAHVERHLSKTRVDFFTFERLLVNHASLREVFGEDHSVVTVRVWTKRFLPGQRDVQLCLLASDSSVISNATDNDAYAIHRAYGTAEIPEANLRRRDARRKKNDGDDGDDGNDDDGLPARVHGDTGVRHRFLNSWIGTTLTTLWYYYYSALLFVLGPLRGGGGDDGKDKVIEEKEDDKKTVTVKVPYFSRIVKTAQWAHDQIPELPFLGWDFAMTDEGLYFIEANTMCSYSKYVGVIGKFYSLPEVEAYMRNKTNDDDDDDE